jgi:hypothetical protein
LRQPNYRQNKKQREDAKKKRNEAKKLRKGQVTPPATVPQP